LRKQGRAQEALMGYEQFHVEARERVAIATIRNPPMNYMNAAWWRECTSFCTRSTTIRRCEP
jgi:enoyl-CoA hydratase/carnithine racemase